MDGLWIRRLWAPRRKGPWRLLWIGLLPVSCAYAAVIQARNFLYSLGLLRARRLTRPVISIGNLAVGGTGKTPACLWLTQELARRGYRSAILSRGYRRKESRTVVLRGDVAAASGNGEILDEAGDEPAMMARIYGRTVAVGTDRYRTGLDLLSREPLDVLILDDGFQHRRLGREVDLVLLGSEEDLWPLPAGPLREPLAALGRADFYLFTGEADRWRNRIGSDGTNRAFAGRLEAQALVGFDSGGWKEFPLGRLYRSKVLAVSGIARPEKFYKALSEWEAEIVEVVEFGDHHRYSAGDWQRINRLSRNIDLVVTTEKDLLKLLRFPFARDKLLALRVVLVVDEGERLIEAILRKIDLRPGAGRAGSG